MQDTPKALRLHIGLFGRRNAGKSTLMNALTGQQISIVSDAPGTTTDPVEKAYELLPLGPVVFIDTAGLDDEGELGGLRVRKTLQVLDRVDLALVVAGPDGVGESEQDIMRRLRRQETPFLLVCNRCEAPALPQALSVAVEHAASVDALRARLAALAGEHPLAAPRLIGDLLAPGDQVVLVVPIDLSAPTGRLILPQVQTIRDVLDSDACCQVVKEDRLAETLARMPAPRLVVCDSQVVHRAAADTPDSVPLTTFSILMSRFKGDMLRMADGAGMIHALRPGARVLISEACSHHVQEDDIGRVKIPRLLAKMAGGPLQVEVMAGKDFPLDLTPYALIVQCGGCMVTRRQILQRQKQAALQGVPMTNYGMTISEAQGVLDRTLGCFPDARAVYRSARQRRP
jgi:[FeFe] hydrogenase H-cluster maturation GTPase HydF